MSAPTDGFYTDERWQNWLDRLRDEDLDPEDEDAARLLWNLQEDAAIAVVKVLTAYDEEELDAEMTMNELANVREIVLADVDIDDEETLLLVDGVQTSLVCVFYAAELYVAEGVADAEVAECLRAADAAESEEEFDDALGHCARAGTLLIDGAELDRSVIDDVGYGPVAEWINGLGSLESALSDPELIEEDEETEGEA
ncbi:DUF2150 family protein [Halococcus saccharolyticus]|uniref:DUF2150 domain-containing protein n=1 Tax=Halococcus saccharolyticus DSM 5350 TaxID=1227455 RepID=M0MP86_9EURY|nr:DUF2150 family protein [Halococcus saccharolyticus]EMA46280.1 hypothetical protein C449_04585 [Halococcus saccharolyticus DSM 5350]